MLNKVQWANGPKLHDMTLNKPYSMLPGLREIYNWLNLSWKFKWSDSKWSSNLSHIWHNSVKPTKACFHLLLLLKKLVKNVQLQFGLLSLDCLLVRMNLVAFLAWDFGDTLIFLLLNWINYGLFFQMRLCGLSKRRGMQRFSRALEDT